MMNNNTYLSSQRSNTKKTLSLSSAALTGLILSQASFATSAACLSARIYTDVDNQTSACACLHKGEVLSEQVHHLDDNTFVTSTATKKCADSLDMTCAEPITHDLTPGTHYFKHTGGGGYYQCDWTENAGFSNAKLYMPPPPVPENVQATAISATEITLTWKINRANRVQTGFKIESPAETWLHTTARMDTRYEHSDLTCNTNYDYVIKATNIGGDSVAVTASATTLPCPTPPSAPEELTAVAVSPHHIDLHWNDTSDDEDGFKIEDATGLLIHLTDSDEETYSHQDLMCDTTYNYVIKATSVNGDSTEITANATTLPCPILVPPPPPTPVDLRPASPMDLVATVVSAAQIDLTWTDQSVDETGFMIENDMATWSDTLPANLTHYRHTGLICNTTYHYVVKAVNDHGYSPEITTQATTAACQVIDPTPIPSPSHTPSPIIPTPAPTPPPVQLPPTVKPSLPVVIDTDKNKSELSEELKESEDSTIPALPVDVEEELPLPTPPAMAETVETEITETEEALLPTDTPVSEENPAMPEVPIPEMAETTIPEISTPETTPPINMVQTPLMCKSQPIQKSPCNGYWQPIHTNLITKSATVVDVIFSTSVENNGWLINAQLTETAVLTGGKLSGTIVNHGIIRDVEFVGKRIQGGYLGGLIRNNSTVAALIMDVTFEPHSVLTGGYLSGIITGNPIAPVLLQGLTLLPNTQLSHVILGDNIIFDPSVVIGAGVRFARDLTCDAKKQYARSLLHQTRSDSCLQRLGHWVQLTIAEAHRGQSADIIFTATDKLDNVYTFDGHDWQNIPAHIAELASAMLFEQLPLTLEFDLPKINHFKTVYIGYRLENGDIVYWHLK
jgi:hypothetical protein